MSPSFFNYDRRKNPLEAANHREGLAKTIGMIVAGALLFLGLVAFERMFLTMEFLTRHAQADEICDDVCICANLDRYDTSEIPEEVIANYCATYGNTN